MNRLDEYSKVSTYFYQTASTVDGMAWLIGCAAALVSLIDIFLGFHIVPLRDVENTEKSIALLSFSPLLIFLFLVCLRQIPLNQYGFSAWLRAAFCLFAFVKINFQ